MSEVIQNLKANATNSGGNYCCISERKLEAIKELAKREEQELSKYKLLYQKALDNTIKSDRELMKYKEANKKAIEYIKGKEHEPDAGMYCELGEYKEYKELLKILEGVINE